MTLMSSSSGWDTPGDTEDIIQEFSQTEQDQPRWRNCPFKLQYFRWCTHWLLFVDILSSQSVSLSVLPSMGSGQSSDKFHCNRYLNGQGPPSLVQQGPSCTYTPTPLCILIFCSLLDHLTKTGLLSVQLMKGWMGCTMQWMAASQRARWPGWSSTETCQGSLMTTLFRSTTYSQMEYRQ